VGVDAPPVPYLEGRWFRLLSPPEVDDVLVGSSVLAGDLTAGRLALAAAPPTAPANRERV
jgi:hypothetical protein